MVAFQYDWIDPSYLPHIIYSAAGERWVDYETWNVNLDERRFEKMCIFYEQFVKEQIDEEKIAEGMVIPWEESKDLKMKNSIVNEIQLDQFLGEIGCVLDGGASYQTFLHSPAAQAWYYESRYNDVEETFKLMALPNENGNTTAHISYFGGIMQSSEKPEAAFEFLKYLLDTEVPAFFGLSVNKENAAKQLDYLTNTTYRLRPGLKMTNEDGSVYDSAADYIVKPMSTETKQKIEEMIAEAETATLPNWPVYSILDAQMQAYTKGEVTIEEAYQNAMSGLTDYAMMAQNYENNEPAEKDGNAMTYAELKKLQEEQAKIEEERDERLREHHSMMEIVVSIFLAGVILFIVIWVIMRIWHAVKKQGGKG